MEQTRTNKQPVQNVQAVSVETQPKGLDLDQLAILLQRRYNILKEVLRLTDELGVSFDRRDDVSEQLVLQMRGEQLQKAEANWTEILLMGESSPEAGSMLNELLHGELPEGQVESVEMERVYRVRRHLRELIEQIKSKDRRINTRMAKEKSYYTQRELNES